MRYNMGMSDQNLSPARSFLASLAGFVADPKRRSAIDKHNTQLGNPTDPVRSPGDKRYPHAAKRPHVERGGHDPLPTQAPHGQRSGSIDWGEGTRRIMPGKQTLIGLLNIASTQFDVPGIPSYVDMAGQTSNKGTRPEKEGMSEAAIQALAEKVFNDIQGLAAKVGTGQQGENIRTTDPNVINAVGRHLKDKPGGPTPPKGPEKEPEVEQEPEREPVRGPKQSPKEPEVEQEPEPKQPPKGPEPEREPEQAREPEPEPREREPEPTPPEPPKEEPKVEEPEPEPEAPRERPKLRVIQGGGEKDEEPEEPKVEEPEDRYSLLSPEARAELERRRNEAESSKIIEESKAHLEFLTTKGKDAVKPLVEEAQRHLDSARSFKSGVRDAQRALKEAEAQEKNIDTLVDLMQGKSRSRKGPLTRSMPQLSEETVARVLRDIQAKVPDLDALDEELARLRAKGTFTLTREESAALREAQTLRHRLVEYERAARIDRINQKVATKTLAPNDVDVAKEVERLAAHLSVVQELNDTMEAIRIGEQEQKDRFPQIQQYLIDNIAYIQQLGDDERPNDYLMGQLNRVANGDISTIPDYNQTSYTTGDRDVRTWGDLVTIIDQWGVGESSGSDVAKLGLEMAETQHAIRVLKHKQGNLRTAKNAIEPRELSRSGPVPSYDTDRLASGYQTDISTGNRAYLQVVGGTDITNKPLYSRRWNSVEELDNILEVLQSFRNRPDTRQFQAAYREKFGEDPPDVVYQRPHRRGANADVDSSGRISFYNSFFSNNPAEQRHTFYHEVGHGLGDAMTNDPDFFDAVTTPNFGKHYDAATGKDSMLSYVDIPDEHIADTYGTLLTGDPKILQKILETFPETVKTVIKGADKYGYPVPITSRSKVNEYFKRNPTAQNQEYLDPRTVDIPRAKMETDQAEVDDLYNELLHLQDVSAWADRFAYAEPKKNPLATSDSEVAEARARISDWKSYGTNRRDIQREIITVVERISDLTGKTANAVTKNIGKPVNRNSLYWGSLKYPDVRMDLDPSAYIADLNREADATPVAPREVPTPQGLTPEEQQSLTLGLNDLSNAEWEAFKQLSGSDKAKIMAQLAQGVPFSDVQIT